MPTPGAHASGKGAHKTAHKAKAARKSSPNGAVALLKADHREVERLFKQLEKTREGSRKQQLADKICLELRVHTRIEEELFYPAARDFLKDDEIVNVSLVEHQAVKDLIKKIETTPTSDAMYDAKLSVLKEMVEHHVEEEEKTLFPKLQKTDMDLEAVGGRLMTRKSELMEKFGATPAMH
jgi:hemerythrin superfamily protein